MIEIPLSMGVDMNKRQKKKFIKKNIIKLRKIHPDKGDVVVFQFDPEYISLDTVFKFYEAWENAGFFDNCGAAIVPCNVKVIEKKLLKNIVMLCRK